MMQYLGYEMLVDWTTFLTVEVVGVVQFGIS